MWDIIKEAPHNAVKAIWTKGHARRGHIDQGKTTLWEMVQNDKAGHAAEEGRLEHSAQMKAMALHYRKALVRYQDLVMRLRAYMLVIVKKALEIFGAPDPEAAFENKGNMHGTCSSRVPRPRD